MKHFPRSTNNSLSILNSVRASGGPAKEAHFDYQRKLADSPDDQTKLAWFISMKRVIQELDEELRFVPADVPLRFLDVGCCPGGFSSYILNANARAVGAGISLPESEGGHSFLLETELRGRFLLFWANLTRYQLGPHPYLDAKLLQPLPFKCNTFDLVLLDGHPLRSVNGKGFPQAKSDLLLISQVTIGLQTVAPGGTIVLKLASPERKVTGQLLYLLDTISLEFRTWKPVYMHATRNTFYVVAKGVGFGVEGFRYSELLMRLSCLWTSLTYGNAGRGRALRTDDLDFIVDDVGLQLYGTRWEQLSQHIWWVQSESLKGWYEANGLRGEIC